MKLVLIHPPGVFFSARSSLCFRNPRGLQLFCFGMKVLVSVSSAFCSSRVMMISGSTNHLCCVGANVRGGVCDHFLMVLSQRSTVSSRSNPEEIQTAWPGLLMLTVRRLPPCTHSEGQQVCRAGPAPGCGPEQQPNICPAASSRPLHRHSFISCPGRSNQSHFLIRYFIFSLVPTRAC